VLSYINWVPTLAVRWRPRWATIGLVRGTNAMPVLRLLSELVGLVGAIDIGRGTEHTVVGVFADECVSSGGCLS